MKLRKDDLDFVYDMLGRICLASRQMEEEDQKIISNNIEEIINIFKKYKSEKE